MQGARWEEKMSLATHDINEVEKRMRASIDALKREYEQLKSRGPF